MRKSPDNIAVGNPKTRRLINLLLAGILLFAPSSNFNEQSDSDNTIENKACEESRRDMFKGIKIVPDSEPKKNKEGKKPKKEDSPHNTKKDCDDCKVA